MVTVLNFIIPFPKYAINILKNCFQKIIIYKSGNFKSLNQCWNTVGWFFNNNVCRCFKNKNIISVNDWLQENCFQIMHSVIEIKIRF